MPTQNVPLLCELHAHTTWSDGELTVNELVNMYGLAGFDVLCITDHVLLEDDPLQAEGLGLRPSQFNRYLAEIELAAARARRAYDLLVLPGLELTVNHPDHRRAGHFVAVGLRDYLAPTADPADCLQKARKRGAALIAAHPHHPEQPPRPDGSERYRLTTMFYEEADRLAPLVDRVEAFNQCESYTWVIDRQYPVVGNGDVHRRRELSSWKTLVPAPKRARAVIDHLRSRRPTLLARYDTSDHRAVLRAIA